MPDQPQPLIFFLPVESYDASQLAANCRDLSTAEFRHAVSEQIRKTFQPYGGKLEILIDLKNITVTWVPSAKSPTPLELAIQLLRSRKLQEAVPILETLLKSAANNPEILRNLGMAYSDLRQYDRAIELLKRATELDASNVDGWTTVLEWRCIVTGYDWKPPRLLSGHWRSTQPMSTPIAIMAFSSLTATTSRKPRRILGPH